MNLKPRHRHKARELMLQALYQRSMADTAIADLKTQYLTDNQERKIDFDYFVDLIDHIPHQTTKLDALYSPYLDRAVDELDTISRAVLQIATYELKYRLDIPSKVIINECIELAKSFGATDSHKYINGVVDKLAKILRPQEMS